MCSRTCAILRNTDRIRREASLPGGGASAAFCEVSRSSTRILCMRICITSCMLVSLNSYAHSHLQYRNGESKGKILRVYRALRIFVSTWTFHSGKHFKNYLSEHCHIELFFHSILSSWIIKSGLPIVVGFSLYFILQYERSFQQNETPAHSLTTIQSSFLRTVSSLWVIPPLWFIHPW